MTPSQLPWSLRTQQTAAAFYRAGYPIEEIADAIGIAPAECRELVERDAPRRVAAAPSPRRPRGRAGRQRAPARRLPAPPRRGTPRRRAAEPVRARARRRPRRRGREPDPTYIGRLLGITPMPDGSIRVRIPLSAALALGEALGFDAHEIEAREVRPRPPRFLACTQGPPVLLAA